MAIKADRWIRHMAEAYRMIEPFSSSQVAEGTISYGLSSYGYDLRLANDFKIFAPPHNVVLNPKAIPPEYYRDHRAEIAKQNEQLNLAFAGLAPEAAAEGVLLDASPLGEARAALARSFDVKNTPSAVTS